MKKGDRIRCIKACGSLNKGDEGVCDFIEESGGGQGVFKGGVYGISLEYFEVIPPTAGVDGTRSALEVQQGGTHYKDLKIQPIEYIHANNIPFAEGCAIKYLTRWRSKGGLQDLEKAKHFIELLIELEKKND